MPRSPTPPLTTRDGRDLATVTARLLRASVGARIDLYDSQLLRRGERNVVVRYRVHGAEPAGISSVVVKALESVTSQRALAFTDWASLEYLSTTPAAPLVPRFYGGDAGAGVFAMQDLGGSRSVDDLLREPSQIAAERALVALAAQYGRLHAATLGDEASYSRLRARLPGAPGHEREAEARAWLAARPGVHRWLTALGCAVPAGFDEALDSVAALYAAPGPFLAFTHGDPAPANNHLAGGGARPDALLLDFEYGGFRHALYDITAWFVLCPLPVRLVNVMAESYRAELAAACTAAQDDERWRDEWAAMCAYRAVAMLTWFPVAILDSDLPWVESWTMRQATLSTVIRLSAVAADVERLAPLAAAAARLERALRSRWPEMGEGDAVLPRWPALG